MRDLPVDLYPSTPPLIQVRGKPATNQPLKQGYIVTASYGSKVNLEQESLLSNELKDDLTP
jgi:hypothetical protein